MRLSTPSLSLIKSQLCLELANKREIKETTHALNVQKLLHGRELKDGEFTFYLVDEAGSVILTQTNDGNGQVTFDDITYNEPGDYHYTIREKAGDDPTITYTDKELKVTVTVTEEDSQLIATAVYEGNQVFENDYTPKAGSVVLNAEKILTGRSLQAEEFYFELVDEAGTVLQTKPMMPLARSTLTLFLTIKQVNTATPSVRSRN